MTIAIGSLFSGIGGLELGIERGLASTGHATRTLWQVEQNAYAQAVLARHWPHAQRLDDVQSVGADELQPVDLLCGGFPCQDISTAGKGAGLAGSRSGLFWELHRIVREMVPRIIVLENVPAIRERGGREVCGALAGLGYDLRWGSLSAAEVGAPHKRERWFCVGWRVGQADSRRGGVQLRRESRELRCAESSTGGTAQQRQRSRASTGSGGETDVADDAVQGVGRLAEGPAGSDLSDPGRGNRSRASMAHTSQTGRTQQQSSPVTGRAGQHPRCEESHRGEGIPQSLLGRGVDGLPIGLDRHRWPAPPGPQHTWEPPRTRPRQDRDRDRLKGLGNAVAPQCAAVIGRWIGLNLLELD